MPHIRPLYDLDDHSRPVVGGKAGSLAALMRAGFDVPPGFVLDTDGTALLETTGWTGELRGGLLGAYSELAGDGAAVAVRSSAVDEDGAEASFAGQHDTVLNVRGEAELLKAVEQCVASLDSAAAVAYRERTGREPSRMAVVVQRMVPAESAGVAFSIDPITGDASRVVVEAVAGLGEQLVSGAVEGDRLVFARSGLEVVEEHRPGAPAITIEQAREAALAALRAEEAFGAPQDIEFAFAEGTLWLLQSRVITATGSADTERGWQSEFDTPTSDADVWTSANVQEILPGLLTPLTMTTFDETVPRAYTMDYHDLKLLAKDEWPVFIGSFYDRMFLNITATRLVSNRAISAGADAIEERYLGGATKEEWPEPTARERLRTWRFRFTSLAPLVRMFITLGKQADRAERRALAVEQKVRALDPAAMSDERLSRVRDRLSDIGVEVAKVHLRITAAAGLGFDNVQKLVRPILGDETEGKLPLLFTGLQGVESAQISIDLWELSRVALREGVAERLRDPAFDPFAEENAAWRERFSAFIERHGHRGLNEMEVSVQTWRRDPASAVAVVRSFLDMEEEQSPLASLARQEQERLALTDELMRRMNPAKRALFRWVLGDAQRWVAQRERTKSLVVRQVRLVEWLLPEVQRRFVERGLIDREEDIFFLSSAELRAVLEGDGKSSYRDEVQRRRREYERNRHVILPERFRGRPEPLEPAEAGHAGDVLTGTPVSAGMVTARARVIRDPRVDEPIQPGEVLVAPVTDAGWTPLFALASGLVVDMGSALSHGSTVAREYGLPAVANVRNGTTVIRTGDLVAVNGTKGTIHILEAVGEEHDGAKDATANGPL